MRMLLEHYFLLFYVSAVLGWMMEVTAKLIQFRRFINRGFLIGPYCPIYGVGSVLITALLSRHADDPFVVFVMAMALCGTLEYLTSYAMEKLFHARWWDYSQRRFNLNGRVCAGTLIPFGLLGLLMVYLVKPFLFGLFARLSQAALDVLCASLAVLMLSDVTVSAFILSKIRRTAELSGADDTEALTAHVREVLLSKSALARRALHAFPTMRLYNRPLLEKLRATQREMRAEFRSRQDAFRRDLEQREARLKADLDARRAEAKKRDRR